MTKYRVEFTISDGRGHSIAGSHEFVPEELWERDSWAIGSDLASFVAEAADRAVWSWFALPDGVQHTQIDREQLEIGFLGSETAEIGSGQAEIALNRGSDGSS